MVGLSLLFSFLPDKTHKWQGSIAKILRLEMESLWVNFMNGIQLSMVIAVDYG